ncbi:MAG: hypothetical protein GX998_03670 [Firmicutes bacterium]|nr:hypothetical protein [Bacillota bacterium]
MYKQALNIGDAWSVLLRFVEAGTFTVTKEMFHKMNALVAKVESLEWGKFRTGSVGIAGTEYYEASLAGIRGDIRSRNRDYTRLLQCRGKSY